MCHFENLLHTFGAHTFWGYLGKIGKRQMNIQEISESSGGQLPKSNCNTVAKLCKKWSRNNYCPERTMKHWLYYTMIKEYFSLFAVATLLSVELNKGQWTLMIRGEFLKTLGLLEEDNFSERFLRFPRYVNTSTMPIR